MTGSNPRIAHGADGAGLARRIYRRTPVRWLHNIWWDHRGLRESDVMLCSYPRSGSTWMRFLMFALAHGEPGSFTDVGENMPLIGLHRHSPPSVPGGGRLIKTHEPYNTRYRRLVHLVRDPRDVALSYWKFMQRIGKVEMRPGDDEPASFDHFIDAFIRGRVDAYSTWQLHLDSYLAAAERHPDDVLRVRFEDMRSDTPGSLLAIAGFLGLEITAEQAARAAEQASIETMRRTEEEAVKQGEDTAFANATRRSGIRAVRSGEVGGWRNRMTEAQNRKFIAFAKGMELIGYPQE